jgi:hypothetical protein
MKVLILFIYSEESYYRKMMDIQKKYIHNFENVDSYFIQMRDMQSNEIEIDNDIIFVKGQEKRLNILLITRGRDPFKGCYAFPGGFVDYGEDPEDACIREL